MKRVLIIINLGLVLGLVLLSGAVAVERSANRQLTQALARATATLQELQAAQEKTNDVHEACRARINELNRSFNSAADQLIAMSMRVRELDAQLKGGTPPLASSLASVSNSGVPATAARPNPPSAPRFFQTLQGTNHQVLGRDLEFSGVYGRRVAFKEAGSSRRVPFDVDQLDPTVLALLGIDAEAQKAQHLRQERAWQQAEATSLALAAAEEQRRREQEAIRIEAEKKRQEQMQQQAASESPNAGLQTARSPDGSSGPPQNSYVADPYAPGPPYPYRVPPWWFWPRPW
jgi:hypothetical protein